MHRTHHDSAFFVLPIRLVLLTTMALGLPQLSCKQRGAPAERASQATPVAAARAIPAVAPTVPKAPSASPESVRPASAPAAADEAPFLVKVNGVALTREDLAVWLARQKAKGVPRDPETLKRVLQPLIAQELVRQRSIEVGLDRDPAYQKAFRTKRAELRSFERKELAKRYAMHQATAIKPVTDAEVRAYFDRHVDRIQTQLHVHQILRRKRAEIEAVKAELDAGKPFIEVAKSYFGKLPPNAGTPWDLGALRWEQIPETWKPVVYDLQPGQVSKIIEGEGRRFWILKLIKKRKAPTVTFESAKVTLEANLKRIKAAESRKREEDALRTKAEITYSGEVLGNP